MRIENSKSILLLTMAIVLCTFTSSLSSDVVEWNVHKTLQIEAKPIDVAITRDGRRIFVLTEQGEVLIYSSTNKMEAKIDVGQHVDQIKLGPRGDTIILTSGENQTVQIIAFELIRKINTTGAPFKGAEDAAVVIAVFDDFQ
jgi:hypothetical protein